MLRTSASKARAQTPAFRAREINDVENVLVSAFLRQHCHEMLIALFIQQKIRGIGWDTCRAFSKVFRISKRRYNKDPVTNFSSWKMIGFFSVKRVFGFYCWYKNSAKPRKRQNQINFPYKEAIIFLTINLYYNKSMNSIVICKAKFFVCSMWVKRIRKNSHFSRLLALLVLQSTRPTLGHYSFMWRHSVSIFTMRKMRSAPSPDLAHYYN